MTIRDEVRWVWFNLNRDGVMRSPVRANSFTSGLYRGTWVSLRDIPTGESFCIYVTGPEYLTKVRMGSAPASEVNFQVSISGKELDSEHLRSRLLAALDPENTEATVVLQPVVPPEAPQPVVSVSSGTGGGADRILLKGADLDMDREPWYVPSSEEVDLDGQIVPVSTVPAGKVFWAYIRHPSSYVRAEVVGPAEPEKVVPEPVSVSSKPDQVLLQAVNLKSDLAPWFVSSTEEVNFCGRMVPVDTIEPGQIIWVQVPDGKGYTQAKVVAPAEPPVLKEPAGKTTQLVLSVVLNGKNLNEKGLMTLLREHADAPELGVLSSSVYMSRREVSDPEQPTLAELQESIWNLLTLTDGHRVLEDEEHPLTMARYTMKQWLKDPDSVGTVGYMYAFAILTRIQW